MIDKCRLAEKIKFVPTLLSHASLSSYYDWEDASGELPKSQLVNLAKLTFSDPAMFLIGGWNCSKIILTRVMIIS